MLVRIQTSEKMILVRVLAVLLGSVSTGPPLYVRIIKTLAP